MTKSDKDDVVFGIPENIICSADMNFWIPPSVDSFKGKLDDIDFLLQELNLKIGKILVRQEMFYEEIVLIKNQQEELRKQLGVIYFRLGFKSKNTKEKSDDE